jgi:hypothetical protein
MCVEPLISYLGWKHEVRKFLSFGRCGPLLTCTSAKDEEGISDGKFPDYTIEDRETKELVKRELKEMDWSNIQTVERKWKCRKRSVAREEAREEARERQRKKERLEMQKRLEREERDPKGKINLDEQEKENLEDKARGKFCLHGGITKVNVLNRRATI